MSAIGLSRLSRDIRSRRFDYYEKIRPTRVDDFRVKETNVRGKTGAFVRQSTTEGLCSYCRKWQRVTINGTLYKHGYEGKRHAAINECQGSGQAPERTRPLGAWKRKRRRKSS